MTAIIDRGTTRDGLIQLRRRWQPSGVARASVLLIHGLGEHCGRYERVGDRLAAAGFDVVSIDNRGCGESGGVRAHVDSWDEYLDDIEDQLAELRTLDLPVVLIGHSLGGLMATTYCASDRPKPDAVVVSGPALGVDLRTKDKIMSFVGRFIRKVAPRFEVVDDFDATVFAEDVTVGEKFLTDPLRSGFMTISLALETQGAMAKANAAVNSLGLAVLALHGGRDKIVPPWASEPFENAPGATRVVYPELGHEVFNEPVGMELVDSVVEWIESTLDV